MISDKDVLQIFQKGQVILAPYLKPGMRIYTQFCRGISPHLWKKQHPGSCKRHIAVFNKFNIIPEYCFNCYKIVVEPRTVIELFKLMVVFEKLELKNDNTRKCMVESREYLSGTYKGFIYCTGIEEGKEILNIIQQIVSKEISNKIPISIKRGCSEYAASYPEFAEVNQNKTPMKYRNEWSKYEDLADKEFKIDVPDTLIDTYNTPTYTPRDAQIMLAWLRYAATVGDLSYLEISQETLQPFANLKRSFTHSPVKKNIEKSEPKIGRNEPCICGSGKKYKKCCAK